MKTTRVSLKHRLEYLLTRGAFGFAALVPQGVSYRIAGWLGGLFVTISKKRRGYALRMLRNAFPDERDDRVLLRYARRGTGNLLRVVLDVAHVARSIDRGSIHEHIDISQLEAIGLTPPWIAVTGHHGSWECGGLGAARLAREAHATARLMRNPLAQRWLAGNRARAGLFVHDRRGGIREITRALENGHGVLQVVDQNQRKRGLLAPWFGEPASTERAAASLAVRQGYPLVVASCIRLGVGFSFRIELGEVIVPERTGDAAADIEQVVRRMNAALEKLIVRFPEQYLWIHDRYRTADEILAAKAAGTPATP
jgi:KDO2-lipid IV(A) lauroyltransferase